MYRAVLFAALSLACAGSRVGITAPAAELPRENAEGQSKRPAEAPPPEFYEAVLEVADVRLHILCAGRGRPVVVFDAGLGLDGRSWHRVAPDIAGVTRSCVYDRAGRGASGPAPARHGQRRMAEELHALLAAARQQGPYVLVGHSMAGANVRWFLSSHPDDVAGMVLLDPATEEWPERVLSRVPREALNEFWSNLRAWEGLEPDTYVAGYEGLRASTATLGERPLMILTAGQPPDDLELRKDMHGKLRRLSSNHVHRVLPDSRHNIQLDDPQSVIAAVRAVVDAVRTGARLAPGADRAEPPTQ